MSGYKFRPVLAGPQETLFRFILEVPVNPAGNESTAFFACLGWLFDCTIYPYPHARMWFCSACLP